ncbi:MAG: hypothetical protein LBT62_07615 [Deltaproteobacteria bacterium]|nr:hypothetical protein [Deltaproteobacteria bacterium]
MKKWIHRAGKTNLPIAFSVKPHIHRKEGHSRSFWRRTRQCEKLAGSLSIIAEPLQREAS